MIVRPRRPAPVLVCRKCLKRADEKQHGNGREIKRALKSKLKDRAQASGEKRAKVVLTSCFGLCPKRAVVMTGGASLARGEFVLVKDSGEVGEAVGVLKGE